MQPDSDRDMTMWAWTGTTWEARPAPRPGAPLLRLVDMAAGPVEASVPLGSPALPDVFALAPAEQLLLWSARRWRHGRFRWSEVEGEFRRQIGACWADALLPWEMALDLLHRLPLGQPEIRNGCATGLSLDEVALLRIPALIQAGQPGAGTLMLARLARRQDREELLEWLALVAASCPCLPLRAVPPS